MLTDTKPEKFKNLPRGKRRALRKEAIHKLINMLIRLELHANQEPKHKITRDYDSTTVLAVHHQRLRKFGQDAFKYYARQYNGGNHNGKCGSGEVPGPGNEAKQGGTT